MYQTETGNLSAKVLPKMYKLPNKNSDKPGFPDQYNLLQSRLLEDTFRPPHYNLDQVFVARDLYLNYKIDNYNWHKLPDWFAVVEVDAIYQRRDLKLSYVIWDENVRPFVVVELLSPGREKEDWGQKTLPRIDGPPTKWQIYEEILQIPYYFVFHQDRGKIQAFKLIDGRYVDLELKKPHLWIEEIQLGLGLWQGNYLDIPARQWLRWYNADGNWIAIPEEQIEQKKQRADLERQLADRKRRKYRTRTATSRTRTGKSGTGTRKSRKRKATS